MMRRVIIFLLLAAAMGLSAAGSDLDLLRSIETIEDEGIDELVQMISKAEEQEAGEPACCNHCGICDRRAPDFARCQCGDIVLQCHPSCKRCVAASKPIPYPFPFYRCLDMAYKDCHRNCSRATTSSQPTD